MQSAPAEAAPDDEMRRSNKASAAAKQAKKRTTHLDLPSHDDGHGGKIHKRKGTSKSAVAVAVATCLAALGTLFFVSNKVFQSAGDGSMATAGKEAMSGAHSIPQKDRFMAQQNRLLPPDSIYRTKILDIHNEWKEMMDYSGSVSLVSNYKELAVLYDKYKSRGFNVLAFPSNDFHQEKETDEEILEYVQSHFPEVKFPLFSRAPLASNLVFQLCQKHTGGKVEWNFTKYLVDGSGRAVKHYGHRVQPMEIEADIVALLDQNERRKMQVPQTY